MAKFIELTERNGEKIFVNLDMIQLMKSDKKDEITYLSLTNSVGGGNQGNINIFTSFIEVKEKPEEIINKI